MLHRNLKFFIFIYFMLTIFTSNTLISHNTVSANTKEIRVGTGKGFPPYYWTTKNGEIKGFDIDILKAVCKVSQLDCKFSSMKWHDLIPSLIDKKIDLIAAGLSITKTRKKHISFSQKYVSTPMALVLHKSTNTKDLSKLKIAACKGTIAEKYLHKYFPQSTALPLKRDSNYLNQLKANKIDGIIENISALNNWIIHEGNSCCKVFKIFPRDKTMHDFGFAFGINKVDTELKEKIDQGIKVIRANGTYKKINDKYFDYNAYGN